MVTRNPHIISALVTPMKEDRSIDFDALEALVQFEMDQGVEGFYCCGSSGEGLLLSVDERKAVAQRVASASSRRVPMYVHTGSLGTREAIELSVHAQTVGAEAVSLIPPIYYHYSQEEIAGYYQDVADAVDLGVIVYNIPQFTGISFSKGSPLLMNPKIVGIKHTSMNLYELERLEQAFPQKTLFNGFDEIFLSSLAAGAQSTIGTTVNVCPKLFKAIYEDFLSNNMASAQARQHLLNSYIEAMVKEGIFSAVKYSMTLLGVPCGPCRKPMKALDAEAKTRIETALHQLDAYLA